MDSVTLMSFSAAYVSRYLLALIRVMAALGVNPILGSARVPLPARIGLGLFVTFIIFPPGPATAPVDVGPAEIAGELLIGLLAGFAVTLIFAAVQFVGNLISVDTGLGFGGTIDPSLNLGTSAVEQFFSIFAMLVFLSIDGHHLFLAGVQELFKVADVGAVAVAADGAERLAALVGGVFSAAIKMALPVIAALLVADVGLAILARVAPQLNLFSLGFPVKIAVGLTALFLALPVITPRLIALFKALPAAMQTLAG